MIRICFLTIQFNHINKLFRKKLNEMILPGIRLFFHFDKKKSGFSFIDLFIYHYIKIFQDNTCS